MQINTVDQNIYEIYIEHLNKWFKSKCYKKIIFGYKEVEYYVLIEGQLEGSIFTLNEIFHQVRLCK